MSIRIGLVGYGNLAKGAEVAIKDCTDVSLHGIFTRRDPSIIKTLTGANVYSINEILEHKDNMDVLILCGGSATDLPIQTPELARHFNVVDSFDTHANIPQHFEKVDAAAMLGGKTAVISVGWDPGMLSLNRLYSEAILPNGKSYTFWGKGISQGHSDAIRRIDGVIDARQYTIPVESALNAVREGLNPEFTTREKHTRECFVVAADRADRERIAEEIKSMPNYFSDYNTTVHFVSKELLDSAHSALPHGGLSIRSGKTGLNHEHTHVIEYSLKLDSNPEFTAFVLIAYARAAVRMNASGMCGCKTAFDIAPAYLSPYSSEELRKRLL